MKKIWKYILIAIPILLVIASAVFFYIKYPTSQKSSKYDEYVKQGASFFENKEYVKSLEMYNQAINILPNNEKAYEGIANILVTKNQLGQLSDILDKSTKNMSNDDQSKLYAILGSGYLNVSNYQQAQGYYQKALDLSYSNEDAKLGLATSLLGLGDYTKAGNYLDIPTNSPHYPRAYLLKLVSKYNDVEKIKEVLADTLEVADPNIKKSIDDYKSLIKADTTDTLYVDALLGRIYVINGFDQLSISLLEPLKDKLLEYEDGVYVLAVSYFNIGDTQKTIDFLKDFSNPNANPDIYLLLARSYADISDSAQATKNFDLAINASADKNTDVYKEYTDFLLNNALYTKAKEVLDKADKKYNDNWIDIAYLRMYFEQKNNAKAQFYMDKLAKSTTLTDPEKKEYMYWAVSQYIETQKNNDASILLSKLKEIDNDNPKYYFLAGKLHLQTANVNDAKSELEKAIDLDITGEITDEAKKLLSRVN